MQTSNIFPECDKLDCFGNIEHGGKMCCNCLIRAEKTCSFYQPDPEHNIRNKIMDDMLEYYGTKSLRHMSRI